MRTEIKRDVLEILERVIEIIRVKEAKDTAELKELSNNVIHDSLIFQDEDSISIGILVYALSKTIERCYANPEIYANLEDSMINAAGYLRKNNYNAYRKEIKKLFKLISSIDKKLKLYVQEVIDQAKVTKGFKLFEHGMSIAKASKLMGITRWELMNYVGNTQVFDREKISTNISKRLAFTRSLFK